MYAVSKGVPATFNRATQHRRALIAKIHVAKKQLAMDEDDYRQILLEHTAHQSLTQCSESELEKVVTVLKGKGFKPLPTRKGKPTAQHPSARKARALWISLYQLGVVRNGGEEALEAFAKRQLKCERLVWARQSDSFKLIEALKQMAERAGWRQADGKGKRLHPMLLQRGLCEQILFRLQEVQVAPHTWTLADAAWKLCGIRLPDIVDAPADQAEAFGALAGSLGRKLREAQPNIATMEEDKHG